jgi:membrane fusion protein
MATQETSEGTLLFRSEAVEAAADRYGRPLNPFSITSWALASFLLLVFATLFFFLATGTYTRKETVLGSVTLSGGAPRVISPRPGVIDAIDVVEGQRVHAGEILITVTADAVRPQGGNLGQALQDVISEQGDAKLKDLEAQSNQVSHQMDELDVRKNGLAERIQRLRVELSLQAQRVELSEVTVRDLKPLFDTKQIAAIQYRQYETDLLESRQTLASMESQLGIVASEIDHLEASRAMLLDERDSLAARIASEVANQKERQLSLDGDRRFALSAPVAGIVTSVTAQPGAPVTPNSTLAVIVPEGALFQAELWVPSRAVGFVRAGQDVRLMYDAFPYQRFGFGAGKVTFVSSAPVQPGDLASTLDATEPMFRVQVSLEASTVLGYGESRSLTPGMRLSADLILEEVTFLDWILDPIRAAALRS